MLFIYDGPHFFLFLTQLTHYLTAVNLKKVYRLENFRAKVLKALANFSFIYDPLAYVFLCIYQFLTSNSNFKTTPNLQNSYFHKFY